MKDEVYPLWSEEGIGYLATTWKFCLNGKENILKLKETFDDIATISKKDENDLYCSESSINLNGAKYECILANKGKGWKVGDIIYKYFDDKEEEKAFLDTGYWKKVEDSRLDNDVLRAMEVTPEKVNAILPSSLHIRTIRKDDMHLLFFDVKVTKDDNDEIVLVDLAPNPRLVDYLECFQVNAIMQARINEFNANLRKDLKNDGIFATNVNDYKNLGYTNSLIRKFRDKGLDILGVSEKLDNNFEQHQAYLKLGTALASFAFEYANNEGIVHKLNSDTNKMYNCYGKQESRQKGEEFKFKVYKNDKDTYAQNKILSDKYKRVSRDFSSLALSLYVVDDKLVEQILEQGLMKSLYAFDERFEKVKSAKLKDIIYSSKKINKHWKLADGIGHIGEQTQKILNNMQNMKFKYDKNSYKLIDFLCKKGYRENILKLMGYTNINSEEYKASSFKKKESIEAKNAIRESSLDNYLKNYSNLSFKLKGELMSTTRYYLTGRINGEMASINPQLDKFQRFLILPKKQMQGTFKEDNQEDAVGVVKALGFSLGMKVENMTNREILEGFNKKFKNIIGAKENFALLDDKDKNKAKVSLNKAFIGTEKFRKKVLDKLIYKVIDGKTDIGEVGSVFKNIAELSKLSKKMQKTINSKEPQTYKNICFLCEIDGTNNGIAFKLAMMPLHQDRDILARCGILDKELYTQMGDYKGRDDGKGGKNTDFYQSFSVNFDKLCKEKNPEFLEAFQKLTHKDPMSKERRDFFKKVVIPAGYGGVISPIRAFNKEILKVYEEKQAKRAYELSKGLDDTEKVKKIITEGFYDTKDFLTLMGVDTEDESNHLKILELNRDCLGAIYGERLNEKLELDVPKYNSDEFYYMKFDNEDNIEGVKKYDKEVYNILNDDVTKGQIYLVNNTQGIAQELVTSILNETLPNLTTLTHAEIGLAQLQCKMYVDFNKSLNMNTNIKNYDYETKVFKGVDTELGGLTYQEGMQKVAKEVLPSVVYGDVTIPSVKRQAIAIYDGKNADQELKIFQYFKGKVKSGAVEVSRMIIDEVLINSGAGASVFKMHPLDAYAARKTVADMDYSALQVYDAFVVNHQQMPKVAESYNKHFLNSIIKENPIEQAINSFDKAVNFIDKVSREHQIPLNEDLKKLISDYIYSIDSDSLQCFNDLKDYNEEIKKNKKELYTDISNMICDQMAGGSLKVESLNELKARLKRIKKSRLK